MPKHPDLSRLKKGDPLVINPAEFSRFRSKFSPHGITITPEDIVYFDRYARGVGTFTAYVTFQGVTTGPYGQHRFLVEETAEDKAEQLLSKIDTLWKRQAWYKECYATKV